MKKGLLSLLALALTVVGCQNYDDQFDELTSQITSLQSTVDGLTGVSTAITALQSTVAAISTAITSGNAANAAANAATAAGLAQVSQTLADLQASLGNVAQTGDLDAISSTLADVQADVRELLEANAVINQNVVINNSATLEYVETLIATDGPNVIVNGYVRINTTNLTDAEVTRANAIAAKLATILGNTGVSAPVGREALTATGDHALTFTNLAFVDGDYVVDGADQEDIALRTVSGHLGINHGGVADAINYSQITSVGGDVAIDPTDAATATSVDFSGTDISGSIHHGAGSALAFPGATTINLGAASFSSLTAAKAGSIVSAITAVATDLTINATKGGTIDFNALETITGDFELTGATTTTFHADALESVDELTVNSAGEAHFPALTDHEDIDITATTRAALTALVTSTDVIDLNNTPEVVLTNFVEAAHTLTWNIPVINLPNVNLEVAMSTTSTDVTVKSLDVIADVGAQVDRLVLIAQDADFTAGTDGVIDLTVTAATGADVDVTADDADLDHVSLDGTTINTIGANSTGIISVALANTSTNTINAAASVATVTLSGTMVAFTSDASTLAEFNNTATFLDKPGNSDTPITIHIHDSTILESIDLSSMEKVAIIDIQGNSALETVLAPTGATNLLTANAGASFTVKGNSLTASYTYAVAAFPGDGINPPVAYIEACIESPSIASFKDYVTAVLTTNSTVTLDLDYEISSNAGNTNFASDVADDTDKTHGAAGTIDTVAELSLFQATACD